MSASVVDGITFERSGLPAVVIGIEKLVNTTGRGMARAQGVPDYPIAVVGHELGIIEDLKNDQEVDTIAKSLVDQVEAMLLGYKK